MEPSWDKDWVPIDEAKDAGIPDEVVNAALIEADMAIYGTCFVDVLGRRINPLSVQFTDT